MTQITQEPVRQTPMKAAASNPAPLPLADGHSEQTGAGAMNAQVVTSQPVSASSTLQLPQCVLSSC